MTLTYDQLVAGIAGDLAGARCIREFEPLGGPGDKIFPPTYGVDGPQETRYATETRTVRGKDGTVTSTESVVLDSVSSEANRYDAAASIKSVAEDAMQAL